jgi:hypothetical protein
MYKVLPAVKVRCSKRSFLKVLWEKCVKFIFRQWANDDDLYIFRKPRNSAWEALGYSQGQPVSKALARGQNFVKLALASEISIEQGSLD